MNSHVTHGAAGILGGVAAGALLALASHLTAPTPIAKPAVTPKEWLIDPAAITGAIKPFKPLYVEIICGEPICETAANEIAEAVERQGIDADVSAPIGRVPPGLTVSGGKSPDPAKVAIAINKATGGRLPISFLPWRFYKAGTLTISFGRLK